MAGQMGNTYVTKKNLKIVQIDEEKRLMMVKGSIQVLMEEKSLFNPQLKRRYK